MPAPIYLDYAATTPVDPRVAEVMMSHLTLEGNFANPASRSHFFGWQAEAAVEAARKQVASLLNADTREIVWTSGATEANNLALKGAAELYRSKHPVGGHIITSATEHKAVLDCVAWLEGHGFRATYIKPGRGGVVTRGMVSDAIETDTFLVSVMHVNNETGVINPVESIAALLQPKGIWFHVDAAQSAGKLPLDLEKMPISFVSVCAHKIYGPKGVGALFVRREPGLILPAQIHGGGHERGMRSGTLPTHQIAAMGRCFELANDLREEDTVRCSEFKARFLSELGSDGRVEVNGDVERCVPNILNLSFSGVDGQMLLSALPGLAVSSGSACTSASMAPSHVLKAMDLDDTLALSALRVSFGRYTTTEQVVTAARTLKQVLEKL